MSHRYLTRAALLTAAMLTTLVCVGTAAALSGTKAVAPHCYVLRHQWGSEGEGTAQFGEWPHIHESPTPPSRFPMRRTER
jgi:hypothetical protein